MTVIGASAHKDENEAFNLTDRYTLTRHGKMSCKDDDVSLT